MWCHSFLLSEPFALAISSLRLHRGSLLGLRVLLTMRELASHARKSRTRLVCIDTQYGALVSHLRATTTKEDSQLEEMSI